MEFNELRDLIIKDQIEEGLQLLLGIIGSEMQNDVILLTSQFKNWEKNHRLNLGAPIEERNRIIYATLHIISQIEKDSKKGLESKRIKSLADVELDLAVGYEKLVALKTNGAIDLFMIWLANRQPEAFQTFLEEEKKIGKATSFVMVLSSLDLTQFASEYNLNVTSQGIYEYILDKGNSIPMFFTGWLEYSNYKEKFVTRLTREVEKQEQKHRQLLKTGIIGAILGAASFSVVERTIDKVIDLYESGIIDTDSLDALEEIDNDDDDD